MKRDEERREDGLVDLGCATEVTKGPAEPTPLPDGMGGYWPVPGLEKH